MPEHFFRVKIAKGSKLLKYEQELKATLQIGYGNQLNRLVDYSRSLFQNCLNFTRLQTNNNLSITLQFTKDKNDLNAIIAKVQKFAHGGEKPKCQAHAFSFWNKSEGNVFVDFGYFCELLGNKGYQAFIITLTDNYIHEIIHCFSNSTVEQQVHDKQCDLLESFLGIILPLEAKSLKSSEFYYKEKDR